MAKYITSKIKPPESYCMNLVSYILCVRNGEKTLPQTLQSLISQKGINLEIIAVDDGSVDSSLNILKQFGKRDNRIKIIRQSAMGLAAARNNGIKKAAGNYIASASQDDIYLPDKTVNQIEYMRRNNLDFCFTEVDIIDKSGKKVIHPSRKVYNSKLFPWPFIIFQVILFMDVCSPTFLCERKCYKRLKWNPGFILFSDKQLWVKMFLSFKGGKVPEILLLRRIKDKDKIYHQRFPLKFLYLEHRVAVLTAVLHKILPQQLIPGFNDFLKLVKACLNLEKNQNDMDAFRLLADIYKRQGLQYQNKYFLNIIKSQRSNHLMISLKNSYCN